MSIYNTQDAGFFAAVHQMVEKERQDKDDDRRGRDRHNFRCLQLLAPMIDGELPDQSLFRRVLCQDLSRSGFSYFSQQPPAEEQVVVALGRVPFTFVTAQVMQYRPMMNDGAEEYLVGCQFTGRIS